MVRRDCRQDASRKGCEQRAARDQLNERECVAKQTTVQNPGDLRCEWSLRRELGPESWRHEDQHVDKD